MWTSEDVKDLGLYSSECCDEELIFDAGDVFSRCPRCERLCEWDLIELLMTPDELEELEQQAA